MTRIQKVRYNSLEDTLFTILIPTWNNLEYLKLCVDGIRQNSRWSHQIVLHINEGTDGTLEWAKEQRIDHTFSEKNVGICYGMNSAADLAGTDHLVYMNDDMYVCPAWDHFLREELLKIPDEKFFLSSTLFEPRETGNACVIATDEFGDSIENFKKMELLHRYNEFDKADWCGATWAPNLIHKKMWELVGGFSVEFSPGMYSDPDLSMKLWQAGVRFFKGVSQSRVFHFQAKSTGRVKRNDGRRQFIRKWNISSGTFTKHYLKIGTPFQGPLENPEETWKLKFERLRGLLAT